MGERIGNDGEDEARDGLLGEGIGEDWAAAAAASHVRHVRAAAVLAACSRCPRVGGRRRRLLAPGAASRARLRRRRRSAPPAPLPVAGLARVSLQGIGGHGIGGTILSHWGDFLDFFDR
jgi:hypothetical protein